MTEPVAASHSRESSVSLTSSDSSNGPGLGGLVLSVSALSRRGGQGTGTSPRSEESTESLSSEGSFHLQANTTMGGTVSNAEEEEEVEADLEGLVRLEPEGINETDSQNFTSFLSVDKRLFGRLQDELNQAQSQLKVKEEQVVKLSRIRDDVEREMEDLTASLFQVSSLAGMW